MKWNDGRSLMVQFLGTWGLGKRGEVMVKVSKVK